MPAAFDRRKLDRLIVMDVVTHEVTEEELSRDKYGGENEAHTEHNPCLSVVLAAQWVPRPRRGDTEGAGNI